jgi:hypothetical protein
LPVIIFADCIVPYLVFGMWLKKMMMNGYRKAKLGKKLRDQNLRSTQKTEIQCLLVLLLALDNMYTIAKLDITACSGFGTRSCTRPSLYVCR